MEPSQNKNVQAFLFMIRKSEGTAGADGYRTMFGNRLFDSYADHPHQYFFYRDLLGKEIKTSAAGAYQVIYSVWTTLKERLHLPDFSPTSQDLAAIELIREKNALNDIIAGRFDTALNKVKQIWASLPGAGANQPEHKLAQVKQWYEDAGGVFAA
ncbi:glycoside hydrolase family 24 protein [Chitinophagaceae bacterium MMS25-I14]